MVQILNKMVHLKYPILEIWCCHKHITQLPPSRLQFDTKLRKVFPNNLAPQLCTSHSNSRRENTPTERKPRLLEIWCCHKHANQLLPSGLKLDTKLRKVFPNNLAAQLCSSHSRRQNIPPNFVCLFQPIKYEYKHLKLRFLDTFGTCYSSQMPSSRLNCGKKLRNTSPSRLVSTTLHNSLLQAKYIEYCI